MASRRLTTFGNHTISRLSSSRSTDTNSRTPADNQLVDYKNTHQGSACNTTYTSGEPVDHQNASLTIGPHGVMLLQDRYFIDELSHFDRERIPERVVHAKGAAAFGYLEVTRDITRYSAAKVFETIRKKTPIALRFSQVGGELGSADTVRDPRGFAIKFYTDDGIWDLTGNNTPLFFIRDPILFPSLIHTQKRNPVTHLKDWDAYWDFFTLRTESTHQVMFLHSDRGIPDGYRKMHGFGSNTYSLINAQGVVTYCKFHFRTNQGIHNLAVNVAEELAGSDPDYSVRDLYNSIASGHHPSWKFYIQVMTVEQANTYRFDPFDVTKVWYKKDFPLIEVGKIVLNRNPSNYFAEVEQLAFDPARFVPGIGASPDRLLQGRLFSYVDTQLYRLGANYLQLPVNSPFKACTYTRDGKGTIDNQDGAPNYHPNSFEGPVPCNRVAKLTPSYHITGDAGRYDTRDEDNYTQPRKFYREVLNAGERTRLINNLASTIKLANNTIQERAIHNFSQVDPELGSRLAAALQRAVPIHTEI